MQKSIILGDRVVEYTLTYKRVKNINIRVKSNLTVSVSAPLGTSESQIIRFITQSETFILSALTRYANLPKKQELKLVSGEKIYYLGTQKTLLVQQGISRVYLSGDSIVLQVADPQNFDLKNKVLFAWLGKECERVVLDLCKRAYEDFKDEVKVFPEIKFRNMRSGWGNCRPRQNRLTFAYMLVKASLECINYVVYHEFVHFLELNHSSKFYAKLSLYLPAWKTLKTQLREFQ